MKNKKYLVSGILLVPFIATPIFTTSCSSILKNDKIESDSIDNSNAENSSMGYGEFDKQVMYFFGKKQDVSKQDIIDLTNKVNFLVKQIEEKSLDIHQVNEMYENINQKLNNIFDLRNQKIKDLKLKVYDKVITFEQALEYFNKNVVKDNRFTTDKWTTIMNITKERIIAESRYSKSFTDSQIEELVSGKDRKWIIYVEDKFHPSYEKICDFFDTFGYLDIINEYSYELLIFPYLFEKTMGISYGRYLEQMGINTYDNDKIVFLYRVQKEISLINTHLNWYNISPETTNSYWFNWINDTKELFNKSFDKSGVRLKGSFSSTKPGDWDGTIRVKPDASKIKSLLPEEIKNSDQKTLDKYIKELVFNEIRTDKMTREQKKVMMDQVYNRICYIVEFNQYKKNYFLEDMIHEKDINKVIENMNRSLFSSDMKIKSDKEIVNAQVDQQRIEGLYFLNEEFLNSSIVLTEDKLEADLNKIVDTYNNYSKESNMHRIYVMNYFVRKFDSFREMYFELSVFPHLFEQVRGLKYGDWIHDVNAYKEKDYGYLYKDYMLEQYLTYRDWNIFYDKYKNKATHDYIRNLTTTTLNSNWYKWFNSIDNTLFDFNYLWFTGVVH